jgi:hypothetical protein
MTFHQHGILMTSFSSYPIWTSPRSEREGFAFAPKVRPHIYHELLNQLKSLPVLGRRPRSRLGTTTTD